MVRCERSPTLRAIGIDRLLSTALHAKVSAPTPPHWDDTPSEGCRGPTPPLASGPLPTMYCADPSAPHHLTEHDHDPAASYGAGCRPVCRDAVTRSSLPARILRLLAGRVQRLADAKAQQWACRVHGPQLIGRRGGNGVPAVDIPLALAASARMWWRSSYRVALLDCRVNARATKPGRSPMANKSP